MALDAFDGVALLVQLKGLGADGHALVELDMAAKAGGLSDDNARAVVDAEVFADGGPGVYVDAGLLMGVLGHDAGQKRQFQQVELVRQAVDHGGVKAGIAQDDLFK